MRRHRLLRSRTFRLTLGYLCVFSASVLVLVGAIYWMATGAISRQIETTVNAEIQGLAEQYRQRHTFGLIETINSRSRYGDDTGALYFLAGPNGQRLAGNLSGWPVETPDAEGWVTFRLQESKASNAGIDFGRARVFNLSGGLRLLVGHDVAERVRIGQSIQHILAIGLVVTVLGLLLGSFLMSRSLLREFDAINRTSREIMAGDFSRRIPTQGRDDEFDQLAGNLNAMLEQIDSLLTGIKQVTDNIAHDLRTPLGRLRNRLESALMEDGGDAALRDAMQRAIADADGLLKTFNALLSIGQAESGAARRQFTSVDLGDLIASVVDLYEPVAEEKGLTLTIDAPAAIAIDGNRALLFQAVTNLLDNAIKHGAPSGDETGQSVSAEIRIALAVEPGTVRIAVCDRGPGIPESQRDRVLERFYRLETSRSTAGNGLGLSLVAAVARLHNGNIALADNHPGLRAELSLPISPLP